MKRFLRSSGCVAVIVLIALSVAACGGTNPGVSPTPTTAGTTLGASPTPTTAETTPGASPTRTPTTASTATAAPSSALVKTAQLSVKGATMTVLTDASGKPLYYLTADTATTLACTGSCPYTWPPLLATGTPTSATPLPHQLTILTLPDGQHVEYDGHPLYIYSGDSPLQAYGDGIQAFGGTWHVVTPDL